MADTPKEEKKVHDIELDNEHEPPPERRTSIADLGHHARPRPYHIPRYGSQAYQKFKQKQECALKIALRDFEQKIEKSTGVARLELSEDKLTVQRNHSQSKLSQQELADLQKATHFDKKELQQWYKGMLWTGEIEEIPDIDPRFQAS